MTGAYYCKAEKAKWAWSQGWAKFKIRFDIVSKALKSGFLIFCMKNAAKKESKKCSASG